MESISEFRKRYNFEGYTNAIWSGYFKDITVKKVDGEPSLYYYADSIKIWLKQRDEHLHRITTLKKRWKLLEQYNRQIHTLMLDTVTLFRLYNDFDYDKIGQINTVNFKRMDLLMLLEEMQNLVQVINYNIINSDLKVALHIQHYLLLIFDEMTYLLNIRFYIKLEITPLYEHFVKLRNSIETAIDIEKFKLMVSLKDDGDEVIFDDDSSPSYYRNDIFVDSFAEELFLSLHEVYKIKKTLADYSFLWHQLQKDGKLVCRASQFLKYLDEFQINFDRFSSNNSGIERRLLFYSAKKDLLSQKKYK